MVEISRGLRVIDSYKLNVDGTIVDVTIYSEDKEPVPIYNISILNISRATQRILNKLKEEFVSTVRIAGTQEDREDNIKKRFRKEIRILVNKYFPNIDHETSELLIHNVIQQNVGLGNIEILLKDRYIEEIVVNCAEDPVWVYHRKLGWLKTNVYIEDDSKVRHYSTSIGRTVGKEITLLKPLMDAHLKTGDRVNATLKPISTKGNTITIRKFSEKPWSITDLVRSNTFNFEAAAWVWLAIQNEMSMLIAGGTGSGKTSTLNAISNFFPPNQRIISIEDTREITLPNTLHWVPMETRLPNPEGKGEITMLDLVINSLRMRPDRIIMGEVRRKNEAEVLFEAMHTGHSVYATLHANNTEETITRLTTPPIDMPKAVLESLSFILVQNRNRKTGTRRIFQLAEIEKTGDARILMQRDIAGDQLKKIAESKRTVETLQLYTGMKPAEMEKDIEGKIAVLKWLVRKDIDDVHKIGIIMSKYYAGKLRIE